MSEPNDFRNQSPDRLQPPPPQPFPPPYQYGPPQPPQNGKAIAAMVLGIASIAVALFGFILGPLAIIYGKSAKREIMERGERGESYATAGVITGIIGLCVSILAIAFNLIFFLVIMSRMR